MSTDRQQPIPLTVEGLEEKVLQAFRLWHASEHEGSPLHSLQVYQQICNRNVCNTGQAAIRQASNELLRRGLEPLRIAHPDEHLILSLRFADEQTVQVVANRMNLAEGSVLRKQQQGIRRIAEYLYHQERQVRASQRERLLLRLPTHESFQLWGIEEAIAELTPTLMQGQAPWLVIIEGAAGIGKSTLAEALCRRLIDLDLWEEFAWVSLQRKDEALPTDPGLLASCAATNEAIIDSLVRQIVPQEANRTFAEASATQTTEAQLDRLILYLKECPHLLVIDGVEAYPDARKFFELMARLANPSKVLLTSRLRNYYKSTAYHYTLGEMSASHTLQMLCHEARLRNLRDVANASENELYPIYTMVGGNPLATQLVVQQLHIYTLSQVLADLATASSSYSHDLYQFLFREVWEQLDEATRCASFPLLLITETGDTFEELASTLQQPTSREELRHALEVYVKYSLLDVRGSFVERRYVMHHLTRTFLRQQILRWIFSGEETTSHYAAQFKHFVSVTITRFGKMIANAELQLTPKLVEKTKYLLEYAFQYETLAENALDLLIMLIPLLDSAVVGQSWFPIFRNALQVSQQLHDTRHESQLQRWIHACSAVTLPAAYRLDTTLPARIT